MSGSTTNDDDDDDDSLTLTHKAGLGRCSGKERKKKKSQASGRECPVLAAVEV